MRLMSERSCRGSFLVGAVSRATKANTCPKHTPEPSAGRITSARVASSKEGRVNEFNSASDSEIVVSVAKIKPPKYSALSWGVFANGSKVGEEVNQNV